MLQEIKRIYQYHDWANQQVLDAAKGLNSSELNADLGGSLSSILKTLNHIACVELLFMRRWQELPTCKSNDLDAIDQIISTWQLLETERNEYLNNLEESKLARTIHYLDTRGRSISLELWQAIFQCINHSTFHRGQIIEKLRKLEKTPPATDFVLFCLGLNK